MRVVHLKWRLFNAFQLLMLSLVVHGWLDFETGIAAEPSGKGDLDSYLRFLGYEGIQLKGNEKNKLQVEARIGEKKSLFMVDSGWGFSTLDEQAARGLKRLGELGSVMEDGRLGTLTDPSLAIIEKLVIGRAQFFNQPARVEKLQMDYLTVPYDGVLGGDFYLRNYCIMDCYHRRLYVRSGKLSEQQSIDMAESFSRSGFVEMPTAGMFRLMVKAQINGHDANLLVDTGMFTSLLDEEQTKTFELTRYTQSKTGTTIPQDVTVNVVGFGKVGMHQARVVTIKNLMLGSRQLHNIHYGVCNLDPWGKPNERAWIGILGEDVLEGQGAVIDFASRKVWLSRKQP